MKCIHCNTDSPYKERSNRTCPSCKRRFAFEPKDGDPFTDMAVQSAITRVSANGTVRFLPQHVYHELARGKGAKGSMRRRGFVVRWLLPLSGLFGLGGMAAAIANGLGAFVSVLALVPFASFYIHAHRRRPGLRYTEAAFEDHWKRWTGTHGAPRGLIEPPKAPPQVTNALNDELAEYSFDRAVVCDRPETVDVLLANDFHFENNCAVLTIDGYPRHASPTIRKMLRQNPKIHVFALHDCNRAGSQLATRLRTDPAWFKDFGTVVDVGLSPRHVDRMPYAWSPAHVSGLSPAMEVSDVRWLESWEVSLFAVRPEQLVKRLYRAILAASAPKKPDDAVEAESDVGDLVELALGEDSDASDGGDDGFG